MATKKLNAYERIQNAMHRQETYLLTEIRKANRKGQGYKRPIWGVTPITSYRAEDRLRAKGMILSNRRGSWHNPKRGLWTTAAWKRINQK